MSPDTDPVSNIPVPRHAARDLDLRYQDLRAPLDVRAAHELDAPTPHDMDAAGDAAVEPFRPLGSEEPTEPSEPPGPHRAHAAIARSLHPPPPVPARLRTEADAFLSGAMFAYADGDLAGARLSLLAVVGTGDPDSAPTAMVFLGVIACRHRLYSEARLWFARAAAGPDEHWALVASEELRRMG